MAKDRAAPRQRALIVTREPSESVTLLRLAATLVSTGRFDVHFLFHGPDYVNLDRDIGRARKIGAQVLVMARNFDSADHVARNPASRTVGEGASHDARSTRISMMIRSGEYGFWDIAAAMPAALLRSPLTIYRLAKPRIKDLPVVDFLWQVIALLRHLRRQYRQADEVLGKAEPDIVISGQEFPGAFASLLFHAARRRGIGTLILPFTYATSEELAQAYHGRPELQGPRWLIWYLRKRHPRWVHRYRDIDMMRLSPPFIAAFELTGLAPPQPWLPNSGFATRIMVESPRMLEVYRACGFADDKLQLTGSMEDDVLAAQQAAAGPARTRLEAEFGFRPDWPLFLCAWPSNVMENARVRQECDFASFDELCDYWGAQLRAAAQTCNILVRPHPSVSEPDLQKIRRQGLPISTLPTAELVPLCDVFIASISATIRWAICSGKPVLNYDVFRIRYSDYAGEPAVLTTEEQEEFEALLLRLARDADFRKSLTASQMQRRDYWGMRDGGSRQRIIFCIESYCR